MPAAWLAEHIDDNDLVILHVAMGHEPPPSQYIPGARLVDYHSVTAEVAGLPIEIPPVADLQAVFRTAGVSNDSRVVVYGTGPAHLAARVFLTLEYLGHRGKVSVLDGGLETWKQDGRPVVGRAGAGPPGSFAAHVQPDILMTADQIAERLDDPSVTLIDARPENEYTGERQRPGSPGGHIPVAYNLYWEDLLISRAEPRLKELSVVQARFEEAGVSAEGVVVNYCAIGMRASYTYLISRYLGYDARFYDGSWVDWGARADLPVSRGTQR